MLSYLDWTKQKGFWIRSVWNEDKKIMKGVGKLQLFPIQERILGKALEMDEDGLLKYETILYSCPKKSGKTALSASVGAWYAEEGEPGSEIFCIANDLDSAEGRLMRDIKFHFEQWNLSRPKKEQCKITQYRIDFPNGTFIQALSQSYKSAAGSRHALTLWDELWGYCLSPDTKVLRGDLTWVPVSDLQVGDTMVSFDEERPEGSAYRSWKVGNVTGTGLAALPSCEIKLSTGKILTATENHKWLVKRGSHNEIQWVETGDLNPGDKLMKTSEVWEDEISYLTGYLAGALDGEGSLCYPKGGGARIDFTQRENGMLEYVKNALDYLNIDYADCGRNRSAKQLAISKKSDIMKLLGVLKPKRLKPLDLSKLGRMSAIEWTEVEEIMYVGLKNVITLSIDTKTFLAEGYATHNTSELSRRVWDEMVPIPTVTNSMRFISTYAGFENESELLWEMYLRGVGVDEHEQGQGKRIEGIEDLDCWENSRLFTYWTHEPAMPWQTEKYYDEQMASERPSMFMRLHLNQWVTSQESYIPIEWWDVAEKHYEASADRWIDHPFKYLPITIAVDAGVTQDCTAIVAVGYDAKRAKIGLVTHTIWTPEKDMQIDLDQVEKKLLELYNRYQVASIVYDPKHLMQMMYRLKNSGLPVTPFEQTEGNLISGSQLLFELLKNRNVEAYPAPDLRKHVQMAVAKTTQRGFRIVKDKVSKRHHVDGAVALMMACYAAVSGGGVDISQPVVLASPFSDMTVFNRSEEAPFIPPELRS